MVRRKILKWYINRLVNFFKIFLRNKMGAIGLMIIVGFSIMAVAAPLLTDKDPIFDKNLAGYRAAPIWIKYLPTFLGGQPGLSENLQAIKNGQFINGTSGWQWNSTPHVLVMWNQTYGISPGSLEIKFIRDEVNVTYSNERAIVYYEFYYPFEGPPQRFFLTFSFSVHGKEFNSTQKIMYYDPELGRAVIKYIESKSLVAQTSIRVFVSRLRDNKKYLFWPLKSGFENYRNVKMFNMSTLEQLGEEWISRKVDSNDAALKDESFGGEPFIPSILFSGTPGYFRVIFEINFTDVYASKTALTSVNIDNVGMKCLGQAYGLLGTDEQGRDLWSQLVYGSRVSLYVGLLSALISVALGLVVGLAAGFFGGVTDEILMRFSDFLLVIPFLPLMMVLMAILGRTIMNFIILFALLGWMGFARVVRSQVLSLKERAFVEAAKAVGAGNTHIMLRHILPNVMSLVYVTLATSVPGAITAEAALSWLGFYDPTRMSWGRMLNGVYHLGGGQAMTNWWWVIFPGLCIALIAMAFIMLGFALDEVLNPKLRLRR